MNLDVNCIHFFCVNLITLIFRRNKQNAHWTEQTCSLWFGISLKMAEHLVKSTSQCTRHLAVPSVSHQTCWIQSIDERVKWLCQNHHFLTLFCCSHLIPWPLVYTFHQTLASGILMAIFFYDYETTWHETWYPISHYRCHYVLRCVKTLLNYPWLSSLGMSLI